MTKSRNTDRHIRLGCESDTGTGKEPHLNGVHGCPTRLKEEVDVDGAT